MFDIMTKCWAWDPQQRPSFKEIVEWLEALVRTEAPTGGGAVGENEKASATTGKARLAGTGMVVFGFCMMLPWLLACALKCSPSVCVCSHSVCMRVCVFSLSLCVCARSRNRTRPTPVVEVSFWLLR